MKMSCQRDLWTMGKEIFMCVFDPRGVMDNWMMEKTQIT